MSGPYVVVLLGVGQFSQICGGRKHDIFAFSVGLFFLLREDLHQHRVDAVQIEVVSGASLHLNADGLGSGRVY